MKEFEVEFYNGKEQICSIGMEANTAPEAISDAINHFIRHDFTIDHTTKIKVKEL